MQALQMGVNSEPPAIEVKKLRPIPEIICGVNEDKDKIRDNIRINIKRGLPQVKPYETQWEKTIGIALGGPTLKDTFPDLLEKRQNGMPVITVNGSHKYCMDNGLTPSGMVMLDSREFNNRFVYPLVEDCKYFISSQCHPSVFENLKDNKVWIWHCAGDENFDLLKEVYGDDYYPVMGGATIALRAVHMLRMLGFHKFEMYGFDSCITGDHHAYEQPENDDEEILDVVVSGKEFICTAAHYHQAKEFVDMVSKTGEHYDLAVHGDGLISHIIKNPNSLKIKEEVV
jgi:hypothetical protein|tara:strand:+ start:995 stop:1849 length:855 start_codon:yes stop_codon:yes gene_type:complete